MILLADLLGSIWFWLGIILTGLLIARLWIRQLVSQQARLREIVRTKTLELRKEKERAVLNEKIKEEFLANMSHEIRTPMNAVLGLTNLLLEKNPREDQLRYLVPVRQSAKHLLAIINDILDLSRIEAGRMPLETISFSINEMISGLETMLQFKAEEKNLELKVSIDPAIPEYLAGDPIRLNQILVNLGGNAVKFTNSGQVEIEVTLKDTVEDKYLIEFHVRDTGIGISGTQREKIFEAFTQADEKTVRNYGGTGLGLAISQRLVQIMGGEIGVISEIGKGSDFYFAIQFEKGEAASGSQDPAGHFSHLPSGLRVLLAEDDSFNQMVAVDTLEEYLREVEVTVAENGRIAVDKASDNKFDLILMDIQMPEMDGHEATQLIRKNEELNGKGHVPILAMTANVLSGEYDRCIASGMDGHIPKPFEVDDLLLKISTVIKSVDNEDGNNTLTQL